MDQKTYLAEVDGSGQEPMVKPLSRTLATIWGTLGSRFGVCRRLGVAGGKRVPLVPLGWYSEGKSFSIGLDLRKIFDQRQFYTGVLRVGLKKKSSL